MNATLEFAQELVSDLQKLSEQANVPEDVAERLVNSVTAARQSFDYLTEAAARAQIDRPFLWARRVTNATAAAMSAASALVSAQNLCSGEDHTLRQSIRDVEARFRELNARILAEPRPAMPGVTLAPAAPVVETAAVGNGESAREEAGSTAPAPETVELPSRYAEEVPASERAPLLVASSSSAALPRSVGNTALDAADTAPKLTISEWTESEETLDAMDAVETGQASVAVAAAPAPRPAPVAEPAATPAPTIERRALAAEVEPRPLTSHAPPAPNVQPARAPKTARAPRTPLITPTPARAKAIGALAIFVLALVLAAALAYPKFQYYVDKTTGDRLGARIAHLNYGIKQQQATIASLDNQISLLANQYIDAQSQARHLEGVLTPGQRASSELADVQFSIASISAATAQINNNLAAAPPGVHDQFWQLNTAKLNANQDRIAELTARQKVLEAQVSKLAAPPAVVSEIADADKRVEAINEVLRSKIVDRQVLAKSLETSEQYAAVLRAEREKAYHPDRK